MKNHPKTYFHGVKAKSINHDNIITASYGWTRYYYTFTLTQDAVNWILKDGYNYINTRFEITSSVSASGFKDYWAAPKLEKGNKPTDWTPAPEDIDNQFRRC